MARQLRMVRPDLDNLPTLELPPGYDMRTYQKGDEVHWANIISDSFGGKRRNAQDTRYEITGQERFVPEGLYFATYEGTPVGTACAWRQTLDETEVGYVHMVGVVSAHTGHKLGKWVSLAVLTYFRDYGFKCAMLDTDDFRTPAIKTYLNLGFVPVYLEDGQSKRWRDIFEKLELSFMEDRIAKIREILPAELWEKVSR